MSKLLVKIIENQKIEPELIFILTSKKTGEIRYVYEESFFGIYKQICKQVDLQYSYDTFLNRIKQIAPAETTKDALTYTLHFPEFKSINTFQSETTPILPFTALLSK